MFCPSCKEGLWNRSCCLRCSTGERVFFSRGFSSVCSQGCWGFQHTYAAGTTRFYLQVSSESGILCSLKPSPEVWTKTRTQAFHGEDFTKYYWALTIKSKIHQKVLISGVKLEWCFARQLLLLIRWWLQASFQLLPIFLADDFCLVCILK